MSATIEQIGEAVHLTCVARHRALQHRAVDTIITSLAQTAKNWLDPNNSWRKLAIEQAPVATGFSGAMIAEVIDLTFGAITQESLGELLDREFSNRCVVEELSLRGRLQTGEMEPRLITHFLAGNVPMPGIASICYGLLMRSANVVKVSSRDPIFPALFVESLREVDADLAQCVMTLEWTRGEVQLTQKALESADAVIAYGDDHTISTLRRLSPPQARFLGYGHKVSFAVVAKEAMTEENLPQLAQAAAFDASIYDQLGCLSPHIYYVEERGQMNPRKFAGALAEAMAAYQERIPRGQLSVEEAARTSKFRSGYEFRAASDKRCGVWGSATGNDWTVIYDDSPSFIPSCLNRVIFVKPAASYQRVLDAIQKIASSVSTVGLAPMNEYTSNFAADLTRMGVHRVCPIGQMQRPPLSWHQNGRPIPMNLVG